MKIFAIRNKNMVYAYLFSNDTYDDYYIEINDEVKEQDVFLKMFLDKNEKTINNDWAKRWIDERVIPSNRQNINEILKDSNLQEYNELVLLIKSKGKSSMDDNYLEEIKMDKVSEGVQKRREKRIIDFIFDNNRLFVFFMDGITKEYAINDNNELKYIINEKPFLSIFGNEIIFNSKIRYNYDYLYDNGTIINISYTGLVAYLVDNLIKTKDVEKELDYSRQYINMLAKKEKIKKINNDIYLKNSVIKFRGN